MYCLRPIILFVLSFGISYGQRLTEPFEPTHTFSVSWDPKPQSTSASAAPPYSVQWIQTAPARKEIITDIYLPKLKGRALASLYQACTGRRVIVSSTAAIAEFSLIQEASPQHPITFFQAAELIKRSATLEGFTFAPDDGDPNLDVLTHLEGIRCVERFVPIYKEDIPLPEGDEVISYIMTLKHLQPEEAVAIFTKSIGEFDISGSIAVVPNTNTSIILATQRTSVIRELITLKNEMDQP